MEFTVYKKTEEVDEYVGKGAKKKKNKNNKESSPGLYHFIAPCLWWRKFKLD